MYSTRRHFKAIQARAVFTQAGDQLEERPPNCLMAG
jgi:hypothetical protein